MNNLLDEKITNEFKSDCEKYKQDIAYKKQLAKACGIKESDYYLFRPIIGEFELKSIIQTFEEKNFMPGRRLNTSEVDSHNDDYIKSGEFKANMHIHTIHSDGRLTTDEFLEQAANLANQNYERTHQNPALVVAITDHDCIDGAKEVLIKLSKNPLKYKNVRIVLGVELSTITNQFRHLKKPLLIHTHMFCINPFDSELNKFIDTKRNLKYKLATETIDKLNNRLHPILERFKIKLTLEEAALIHELVTKGQDEIYLPMKKYVGGKLLFENYVRNNKDIIKILQTNNICIDDLSYEHPYTKYKYMFKQGGGYSENYKLALNVYLKNLIKEKNGADVDLSAIINIKDEHVEDAIKQALEISKEAHPSLTQMPDAFDGFEDTLQLLSTLDFGVFSIAHPGRTVVKDADTDLYSLFENMFESFKQKANNKAVYYEGYYQSYSGENYKNYLEPINNAAKKLNLIPLGGLDSHGESISCRGGNP